MTDRQHSTPPGEGLVSMFGARLGPAVGEFGALLSNRLPLPDLLREISAISWLSTIVGVVHDVRGVLYARKVQLFLCELESVPNDDRESFVSTIESSPDDAERLGHELLLRLEQHHSMLKPVWLARSFCLYVRGEVGRDRYEELANAVHVLHPHRASQLVKFYDAKDDGFEIEYDNNTAVQQFASAGLADIQFTIAGFGGTPAQHGRFHKNELGRLFVARVLAGGGNAQALRSSSLAPVMPGVAPSDYLIGVDTPSRVICI